MLTNIEQEFFRVFDIDEQCICPYLPTITTEKLLRMICIILNTEGLLTINTEGNIADIKDFVLRFLIGKVNKNNTYCHYKTKNKIKQQIQALFKDEDTPIFEPTERLPDESDEDLRERIRYKWLKGNKNENN